LFFESLRLGATICMPLVKEGRLTALMAIHHKTAHAGPTTIWH
jgi:GAF domain-containing protein